MISVHALPREDCGARMLHVNEYFRPCLGPRQPRMRFPRKARGAIRCLCGIQEFRRLLGRHVSFSPSDLDRDFPDEISLALRGVEDIPCAVTVDIGISIYPSFHNVTFFHHSSFHPTPTLPAHLFFFQGMFFRMVPNGRERSRHADDNFFAFGALPWSCPERRQTELKLGVRSNAAAKRVRTRGDDAPL